MTKRVAILEDDPGYESLLRSVAESRGWQIVVGTTFADLAASVDWADAAIVDLDATAGADVLRSIRAQRPALPVVVVCTDGTSTAEGVGADAVVHQLPVGLVEAVNDVTEPPAIVDLTDGARAEPEAGRPWYATS
jgi:hypothetical protein